MSGNILVWVDIETTGLEVGDLATCCGVPLEIALVVTDFDLQEIARASYLCPFDDGCDRNVLIRWDEAARRMHEKSGLLAECREARLGTCVGNSPAHVDELLTLLVQRYAPDLDDKPVLAGSSVHFDRKWLAAYFPKLHAALHYRNFDTNVLRQIFRMWGPETDRFPKKVGDDKPHRALPDILESIEEARWYRERLVFRSVEEKSAKALAKAQDEKLVADLVNIVGKLIQTPEGLKAFMESKPQPAADMVNHPPHYTAHPSGIECIDVIEHLPANIANAIKYLWRMGKKPTVAEKEDLETAKWYLRREGERLTSISYHFTMEKVIFSDPETPLGVALKAYLKALRDGQYEHRAMLAALDNYGK